VYYQHPDDHNEAYAPKLVVTLGFVLAGATVLLLPLDVANNEGYPGECNTRIIMIALYLLSLVSFLIMIMIVNNLSSS